MQSCLTRAAAAGAGPAAAGAGGTGAEGEGGSNTPYRDAACPPTLELVRRRLRAWWEQHAGEKGAPKRRSPPLSLQRPTGW